MIKLSVNVNKVATIRNSRGGSVPSVLDAAGVAVDAGAHGITVHPRADARHITFRDVEALADILASVRGRVEFNIEGDPRPDLLELVRRIRPDQCTLVPVLPGEVTSQAGWPSSTPRECLLLPSPPGSPDESRPPSDVRHRVARTSGRRPIRWQAAHPTSVKSCAPRAACADTAVAGLFCLDASHRCHSAGACATTTRPIKEWAPPQNSAHWPP